MHAQLYPGIFSYNCDMSKVRADILLVNRGLAESRSQAQRLVMAGQVRADGQVIPKPSTPVADDAVLVVEQGPPFVSRGGEKLHAALHALPLDPASMICADVGASTGGFTDCLLQHGAAKVYAIDVGKGILHWDLRQDPRVIVMESCNARYLENLPEAVDLVTIDVSFISLQVLLPVVKGWFRPPSSTQFQTGEAKPVGQVIALIKPQFEAGRREVSRGDGVIRDPSVHRRVLLDVLSNAQEHGYYPRDLLRSPLLGPKGNAEFLAWFTYPASEQDNIEELINNLLL